MIISGRFEPRNVYNGGFLGGVALPKIAAAIAQLGVFFLMRTKAVVVAVAIKSKDKAVTD